MDIDDTYEIYIVNQSTTSNHKFELYSYNHNLSPSVASSSLLSPADASGAMAVGSIPWSYWTIGQPANFYSSQGPTNDGRIKPEISGPDYVSTYTYGTNGFPGTSAAAPHVAGAAALLLSKNSYTVSQLWSTLTSSAVDMGSSGQDNIYGYGRLNISLYDLNISKNGTGTGTVTSSPSGVDCGSDCTDSYISNTQVTLTATADANSNFTGWSGTCTGTGSCTLKMDGDKSVTATFDIPTLTVSKSGTGNGLVVSSPSGINCGFDCSEDYSKGTVVTLTALPPPDSNFLGWSGACSGTGTGTCTITMDNDKSVTATFDWPTLTVSKAGMGTGIVTSNVPGISCGADCSQDYPKSTIVTLTATPDTGSTFKG